MKVSEIMVQPVATAHEGDTLEEVARTMLEQRIGCLPVVNDRGELTGIITESDFTAKERGVPFSLIRAPQVFGQWLGKEGAEEIYQAARKLTAHEVMNPRPITVPEDATLEDVLEKMLQHDINRLPVVRGKQPVGIIARHDLLKLMLGGTRAAAAGS